MTERKCGTFTCDNRAVWGDYCSTCEAPWFDGFGRTFDKDSTVTHCACGTLTGNQWGLCNRCTEVDHDPYKAG